MSKEIAVRKRKPNFPMDATAQTVTSSLYYNEYFILYI